MVNIKNAAYDVTGKVEQEDIRYHFQTNAGMLTVLDEKKNIVGNLSDLLMKGIPLDGVDYKTLKLKGLYGITNIKGIDPGLKIDVNKMSLLSVTPYGEVNNPKIVIYKLITTDGRVFDNVINSGKEIGWTSGGKELEGTLTDIKNVTGSIEDLKTTNKESLASAINEVHDASTKNKEALTKHEEDYEKFKKHDHDSEYVKRSGGNIKGSISIDNNVDVNAKNARNEDVRVAHVSSTDLFSLGSKRLGLDLLGNGDFKYNGKKVWTEVNHGKDSGLDADKIGGTSYRQIPVLNKENTFTESIKTSKTVAAKDFQIGEKATLSADENGRITIKTDSSNITTFERDGRITAMNHLHMNAKNNEVGMTFGLTDDEARKGMGFYRNGGSKYLGVYNWSKNKRLAYFSDVDERLYLDQSISIQGRKLYLQSGQPPVGKAGDIWIK